MPCTGPSNTCPDMGAVLSIMIAWSATATVLRSTEKCLNIVTIVLNSNWSFKKHGSMIKGSLWRWFFLSCPISILKSFVTKGNHGN